MGASKNVGGLVSLFNGFQVVRMVELLGLFGFVDHIRGRGRILVIGKGSGTSITLV